MEQSKLEELLKEMSLEEKIGQLFQGNGGFYEGNFDTQQGTWIPDT